MRAIDLGTITPLAGESGARYFCTVGGVGLDSEVARRANALPRWLRGNGGYALSLIQALSGYAPARMTISARERAANPPAPTFFAAFANAPAYGGGMKIAPRAQMDDGRLDVCILREVSKLKLLTLFPSVYFGRHVDVREIEYFQTEKLTVEAERTMEVYADGEFVSRTPVKVGILRRALPVIVPSGGTA